MKVLFMRSARDLAVDCRVYLVSILSSAEYGM